MNCKLILGIILFTSSAILCAGESLLPQYFFLSKDGFKLLHEAGDNKLGLTIALQRTAHAGHWDEPTTRNILQAIAQAISNSPQTSDRLLKWYMGKVIGQDPKQLSEELLKLHNKNRLNSTAIYRRYLDRNQSD
jgi:hypothetical protein